MGVWLVGRVSGPLTVVGPFLVPLFGGFPGDGEVGMELFGDEVLVELVEAESGLVGDGDEAVLDFECGLDDVLPPGDVDGMDFECHEVAGGGGDMDGGEAGDGAFGHVDGHLDGVFLGEVADALGLEDAAGGEDVGVDDGECAGLEEWLEGLLEVHVLAGADRCGGGVGEPDVLLGVLPWDGVLHPGEVEFLESLGELDAVLERDVSEVVDGDGYFVADGLAALAHVVLEVVESDFGEVDAGEGVREVEEVVGLAAHGARVDGAVRGGEDGLLVLAHLLQEAAGGAEGAGDVHEELDAEVHLEEGVALRDALLEGESHVAAAAFAVGVAVDADFVAEFAAEHLPDGDAPGLAGEVPAGDFEGADAAGLSGVAAELLESAEDFFDIAGVFAEDAAFEHGGVGSAGGVADFAVADESLVGVDFDEGAALGCAVDVGEADISDFEVGGVDAHGVSLGGNGERRVC